MDQVKLAARKFLNLLVQSEMHYIKQAAHIFLVLLLLIQKCIKWATCRCL